MTRGGRTKKSDEPERRCIATREVLPKTKLIRFVLDGEGVVTPDLAEKLPGRGLWVRADSGALQTAVLGNFFARAAKAPAILPDQLVALVEERLAKRVIELISLARKGGYATCGFDKTKEALISDGVDVLLQASDGSMGQKSKLRPPEGENSYISWLTAGELGVAFGRETVIHAALAVGGITQKVKSEAARLAGVREQKA